MTTENPAALGRAGEGDRAAARGQNRRADRGHDVEAFVKFLLAGEGRGPFAEVRGYPTGHRPVGGQAGQAGRVGPENAEQLLLPDQLQAGLVAQGVEVVVELSRQQLLAVERRIGGPGLAFVAAGGGDLRRVLAQVDHVAQLAVEGPDARKIGFQAQYLVGQAPQLGGLVLGRLFRLPPSRLHPSIIVIIFDEGQIADHHRHHGQQQQDEHPAAQAQLAAGAVLVLEDDDLIVFEHVKQPRRAKRPVGRRTVTLG